VHTRFRAHLCLLLAGLVWFGGTVTPGHAGVYYVQGSWYDQDKYHKDSEPYGGDSWGWNYGTLLNGLSHDPGEQVDEEVSPLYFIPLADNSCWMASAANMLRTKDAQADRYYSWAYLHGITGAFSYGSGTLPNATYTFDEGAVQHWALQHEGYPWAVMAQGAPSFGSWVDPVGYIAASIRAGSPVGIGIHSDPINLHHALTIYGIDTQTAELGVADSDADRGGQDFEMMAYSLLGQNLWLAYPAGPAEVRYICTFDNVGWWTGGTGDWGMESNWVSRHLPNSSQAVYLTQSNVGTVTLARQASVKSLELSSPAVLALANGADLTISTACENSGTVTQAAGAILRLSGGAVLNNLGVYDMQGDCSILGGSALINNAGTFRKSGGTGTSSIPYAFFNNTGTVEVLSGTLSISQGISDSAHYEFSNGGRLNASLAWAGETTANGNGVLSIGGSVATATFANPQFTGGATLEFGANLIVGTGATLTLNMTGSQQAKMVGGSLRGPGTTINQGNFTWSGGNIGDYSIGGMMVNQGNLIWTGGFLYHTGALANQGSLTIGGSGSPYVWGGSLTNAGTVTQDASKTLYMVDTTTTPGGQHFAVLNNLAGALYDIHGDGSIMGGGGGSGSGPEGSYSRWSGGTINNAGLFRKSAGSGTSSIDSPIAFNNTGTVQVDSGTLSIRNYAQAAGAVNVYGGTLNLTGNAISQDQHCEFTSGGRLNASLTWQGVNTANGNGVLAVGGNVAAGTTATFASPQFTNGAALEVGAGSGSSLIVGTGATLTLNMTGSQQAKMVGGSLRGAGTTINQGNLAWSGGNIGDYSTGGTVVNQGNLVWTGGSIQGSGVLTNQSSLTIGGNGGQYIWGVLNNAGTITQNANGSLYMVNSTTTPGGQHFAVVNNLAGALYDIQGDTSIMGGGGGSGSGPEGSYSRWSGGTINNAGLFRKSAGSGTSSIDSAIAFNNTGTVEVDSGTLSFGNFTQTAGSTDLKGGRLSFSSLAQILGGLLEGSGTINGSIVNSGGLLSPGHSAGSIILNGNYTQGAEGALLFELGGLTNGQFDFFDVNGTATFGGTLDIAFLGGFRPSVGDMFHIMDFNLRVGDFSLIQVLGAPGYEFAPVYTGNGLTLFTQTAQAVPEPSTLALLSICATTLVFRRRKRAA